MKIDRKILTRVSAILLNVFSVLLGIIVVMCSIASVPAVESFLTTNLFGGYKQVIKNVGEGEKVDSEYYKTDFSTVAELNEHNQGVCEETVAEGAVLLKNENGSLPLNSGDKVSLFGITSVSPLRSVAAGADQTGDDRGPSGNTLAQHTDDAYRDALTEAGLSVNSTLFDWYKNNFNTYKNGWPTSNFQNVTLKDATWNQIGSDAKSSVASYNDAAIFFIGRSGNEGVDMFKKSGDSGANSSATDNDFLQLSVAEKSVLDQLKAQRRTGDIKNLVIVINSAAPIETNLMDSVEVDSILWVGMTGTSGHKAVADILTGKVNPSGRLSDMWYVNNCYDPTMANYGNFSHDGNTYVVYQEGVYLGYRYAETRYEDAVIGQGNAGNFNYSEQIAYPFGYGLSYTTFDYSNFSVKYDELKDEYTVSVRVTNKGSAAGKEVVQVYLQQPYTDYDVTNHIEKPAVELVGFGKTKELAAGANETVEVVVEGKYFASYDAYGVGSYYRDAGDYYLTAAKDAHAAVNNILAQKGYTAANGMDGNGDKSLVYEKRLSADETTYKTASNTGVEVKNLFNNADPNIWGADGGTNHVDYITRSDWDGTVKLAYTLTHGYTDMHAKITNCKVITEGRALDHNGAVSADNNKHEEYPAYGREDAGHLNLIELRAREGKNGEEEWIPYDDPMWDKLLDQLTWDETVRLLTNGWRCTLDVESINKPITVDHNGSSGFTQTFNDNGNNDMGLASKNDDPDKNTHATGYPCSGIIAASFNTDIAHKVGNAIGEDSIWSGQAGLYGFGLNLHRSPYHGRYAAYYSADSYLTGVIAGYASLGAQEKGCYVYNKHFVMNEQEVNRSNHETYVYEEALRQMYLRPFEIAIKIGDAMCVMTSFTRTGAIWSGNHYNLCTEFLRNEAGMKGFAVTDWYDSVPKGMPGAILAGNDLPDGANMDGKYDNFNTYKQGYADVAWAMRESAHRILYTVVHSNAMNGITASTRVRVLTPTWIVALKGVEIAIGVLFGLSAAAYIAMFCLNKFKPETPVEAEGEEPENKPEETESEE